MPDKKKICIADVIQYADDQVVLVSSEEDLQIMMNRIVIIGKHFVMKMNVMKTKVIWVAKEKNKVNVIIQDLTFRITRFIQIPWEYLLPLTSLRMEVVQRVLKVGSYIREDSI